MKDLLKEAIIIPVLTLFGYMVAFLYQAGYFAYYHIPRDLIEVNLTNIFIAIIALSAILWFGISFINSLSLMGMFKRDTALKRFLVSNFLLLLITLILGYFLSYSLKAVIMTVLIILFSYGMAMIFGGFKGKGIEQRLLHQEEVDRELDKNDIIVKFANNIGVFNFKMFMILILVLIMTYGYGYSKAKNTEEYTFLVDLPQTAIIKIYNNNFIGLEVNEETKTFTDKFTLINRGIDIPFTLVNRKTGKLTYYLR